MGPPPPGPGPTGSGVMEVHVLFGLQITGPFAGPQTTVAAAGSQRQVSARQSGNTAPMAATATEFLLVVFIFSFLLVLQKIRRGILQSAESRASVQKGRT